MRATIELSKQEGFKGRLDSFAAAGNGFYANVCGMTDFGIDADNKEGLRYFEMSSEQAEASSRKEVRHEDRSEQDWCLRIAQLEGDSEIGAGSLAMDPVLDVKDAPAEASEETAVAFSRFVQLARRNRRLTVEKLAEDAGIELRELVSIEESVNCSLISVQCMSWPRFRCSEGAGTSGRWAQMPKDQPYANGAAGLPQGSEPSAALTAEERQRAGSIVSVLSETEIRGIAVAKNYMIKEKNYRP